MTVHITDLHRVNRWPIPKFGYGDHVTITPLEHMPARVIDLHFFGPMSTIEYDVRYFADGKEYKVRVFEDELVLI